MDEVLHRERLEDGRKRLWRAPLGDLPDGAMIAIDGRRARAPRRRAAALEFCRLRRAERRSTAAIEADVLTPPSTVAALAAGYRPLWARASRRRIDLDATVHLRH